MVEDHPHYSAPEPRADTAAEDSSFALTLLNPLKGRSSQQSRGDSVCPRSRLTARARLGAAAQQVANGHGQCFVDVELVRNMDRDTAN